MQRRCLPLRVVRRLFPSFFGLRPVLERVGPNLGHFPLQVENRCRHTCLAAFASLLKAHTDQIMPC